MDFTGNPAHQQTVQPMLADGETLKVLVDSGQRLIVVTNKRTILLETSGNYSAIPHHSLDAVEVSDGGKSGKFIKLYFGGGALSRTISAPDARQAAAVVTATGLG